ncbi:Glycosyltransferase, catalytic subunit of cellulose synthase and poly-beta-1,6-N-acetylglucosamine synthase [Sphingomonas laterariae]|uniref:Glycosyltransferase, catalytic subunit of cellulose synthase and poly-beta-1,6-N-acetylglucosamine synthase n=1 Tax=Edaphosphingomonas laterariae TaxID=861865 RepID=A0A239J2R6_9SPHN|nr:glycosyltransferase family 2 protein [Sphingomonas laterariae]SNS99768.1 Glycosyltransferase, catalytic subunit of cellulose synthase and poly-beta-1,6-N-acetylglucosamine synthase [Sphingomonas laterariae]
MATLSTLLSIIGWIILAPVALVGTVFAVETAIGLVAGLRRPAAPPIAPQDIALVIPAHDEAAGIGTILGRLKAVLTPGVRMLVVADNCTDDTAAVARAAGAEVIARHDASRRGKGFALAFGRDHLRAQPPRAAIVIDADCVADPGALERIAALAVATGRPVQSAYLFSPRRDAAPMVQISNFAFLVKNLIRQNGARAIGAPALLTGSGMAFPWEIFGRAALATDNIVEDLALGVDLTREGHAPIFDPQALTWTQPSTEGGTLTQRTRWENGFMTVARKQALPLIGEALRKGRPALLWTGLHLLTPPLALLMALNLGAALLLGLLALIGMPSAPFAAATALFGVNALLVLAAWALHGRAHMGLGTILRLPLYMLWKLPIYLRLVRGGETRWIRTERE